MLNDAPQIAVEYNINSIYSIYHQSMEIECKLQSTEEHYMIYNYWILLSRAEEKLHNMKENIILQKPLSLHIHGVLKNKTLLNTAARQSTAEYTIPA